MLRRGDRMLTDPQPPELAYSLSRSNLSPLATPFTVDRPLASSSGPLPPPRYIPGQIRLDTGPNSAPLACWPEFWPSATPTTATSSSLSASSIFAPFGTRSSSISEIVEDSYYPCYTVGIGSTPHDVVDPLKLLPDYQLREETAASSKGTVVEGFVACDDEWGPWHGKPVSTTNNFHLVSGWIDDKAPENHEGNICVPYKSCAAPLSVTRPPHKGLSNFDSPDSVSKMEGHNAYNFPSYDMCAPQFVSSSTGPIFHYPEVNSSARPYTPAIRKTNLSMDCSVPKSIGSSVKHADSTTEAIADSTTGPIFHYPEVNSSARSYTPAIRKTDLSMDCSVPKSIGSSVKHADSTTEAIADSTTNMQLDLIMNRYNEIKQRFTERSNDSTTGSPTENLRLKIRDLSLPTTFSSEYSYAVPDNVVETSSETIDLNLAVDSPCWKGAPVTCQFPFDVSERVDPHPVVTKSKDCNDSNASPVQDGNLTHIEKSFDVKIHEYGCFYADQPLLSGETDSESGHKAAAQDSTSGIDHSIGERVNKISLPGFTLPDTVEPLVSSIPTSKCSLPGKDVQVLVKAIHGLSESLSMFYGDAVELKEEDHELAQLTIDNIKAFILKSQKGAGEGSKFSGLEAARSKVTVSKADTLVNPNIDKSNQEMKGKVHHAGSSICNDSYSVSLSKGTAEGFDSSNDSAQALEKALKVRLNEQEEIPQALVYKNLWVEAEVAMCSLKYELKLVRMKLESQNHEDQRKAKTHESPVVGGQPSSPFCNIPYDLHLPHLKFKRQDHETQKEANSEVSSVFTEKSMQQVSSPSCDYTKLAKNQKKGEQIDKRSQDAEAKNAEVHSSVMARLRVLKGRKEKQASFDNSSYPVSENYFSPLLVEGNSYPYTEEGPVAMMSRTQHRNVSCSEENGLLEQSFDAGRKMKQSVVSEGRKKHVNSGGHGSTSSEWEHVLEEELLGEADP